MQRKNKNKYDLFGLGMLAGMLLPPIIFIVVYFVGEQSVSFITYLKSLWKLNALLKVGSLCVFANLSIFWVYLWLKYERAARGVLGATLIYAFVVLISKAL